MNENDPYNREGETVDVIDDRVDSQPDDEEIDGPRYRNEEWLRDQYWVLGKSAREIADGCGVAKRTVLRWMEKFGIERRSISESKEGSGPYTDEDWLREQYVEKEKSTIEIADEFGVAVETIRSWMEEFGIERRSLSEANAGSGPDIDEEWLRDQYVEKENSTYEIADECGVDGEAIRRSMEEFGIERRSKSEASLKRYENTVVFRGEADADESSSDVVEIDRGNARYKGSPIGLDHVNKHIGERSVVEVASPWRDEEWLRDQYVEKENSTYEIADECGVGETTIRRWMDKFGIETRQPGSGEEE